MFRLKICGITAPSDALAAVEAGADAIGLNFFSGSKRCINPRRAAEIASILPQTVRRVGVFVDEPIDRVRALVDKTPLDVVQLHGDESPEYVAQIADLTLVRAIRLGVRGETMARNVIARHRDLGVQFAAILVDALQAGALGGTGQVADWNAAAELAADPSLPPLLLAGGLTPENVVQAIAAVHPYGVDTASGVERSPGVKDPARMRLFLEHARQALRLENR